MNKKAIFFLLAASLSYAAFTSLIKYILKLGVDPLPLTASMSIITIPIMLIFALFKKREIAQIKLKNWYQIILLAILATFLAKILHFLGQSMTSANNVGFLSKLNVLTVLPFAHLMLREKISKKVFMVVIVMLFGTFLLSTNLSFVKINMGDLIIIFVAVILGFTNTMTKIISKEVNAFLIAGARLFFGSILSTLVFSIIYREAVVTPIQLYPLIIIVTTILGIIYLFVLYKGIELVGPSKATILFLLSGIFTPFFAFLFLRETLAPFQFLGGALILIGAYFVVKSKKVVGLKYLK